MSLQEMSERAMKSVQDIIALSGSSSSSTPRKTLIQLLTENKDALTDGFITQDEHDTRRKLIMAQSP